MKRNKTFVASILNIVANVGGMVLNFAGAVLSIYFTILIGSLVGGLSESADVDATAIIMLVLMIVMSLLLAVMSIGHLVTLILSIFVLKASKKSPEAYAKSKKVIIAAVVFDILLIIGSMIVAVLAPIVIGLWGLIATFVLLAFAAVLLVTTILMIVDMFQEKKRVLNVNNPEQPAQEETPVEQNTTAQPNE